MGHPQSSQQSQGFQNDPDQRWRMTKKQDLQNEGLWIQSQEKQQSTKNLQQKQHQQMYFNQIGTTNQHSTYQQQSMNYHQSAAGMYQGSGIQGSGGHYEQQFYGSVNPYMQQPSQDVNFSKYMGAHSHVHRPSVTQSKHVNVNVDEFRFTIDLTPSSDQGDNLTCGWLLQEVIKRYEQTCQQKQREILMLQKQNHIRGDMVVKQKKKFIVALKTIDNREGVDYWLNQYERDLSILENGIILQAYFAKINFQHGDTLSQKREISIEDFEQMRVIGRGGFSKVILARKKDTGRLYAIKILKKNKFSNENQIKPILSERKILEQLEHPFLIKLHWAFQNHNELFFVMDVCTGGELFFHLNQQSRFNEKLAKFYICEILLGFKYLHEKDIVFRDIKPENILVDTDGHIRIADFGLAKHIPKGQRSYSFCGSPEYLCPEMLCENIGHDRRLDIYCLGVLLFEMLTGLPPFYDRESAKMFDNILYKQPDLDHQNLSPQVRSLLRKMLQKNPNDRFQSIDHIITDPWFDDVDWLKFAQKQVKPPHVPNVSACHFDEDLEKDDMENAPCMTSFYGGFTQNQNNRSMFNRRQSYYFDSTVLVTSILEKSSILDRSRIKGLQESSFNLGRQLNLGEVSQLNEDPLFDQSQSNIFGNNNGQSLIMYEPNQTLGCVKQDTQMNLEALHEEMNLKFNDQTIKDQSHLGIEFDSDNPNALEVQAINELFQEFNFSHPPLEEVQISRKLEQVVQRHNRRNIEKEKKKREEMKSRKERNHQINQGNPMNPGLQFRGQEEEQKSHLMRDPSFPASLPSQPRKFEITELESSAVLSSQKSSDQNEQQIGRIIVDPISRTNSISETPDFNSEHKQNQFDDHYIRPAPTFQPEKQFLLKKKSKKILGEPTGWQTPTQMQVSDSSGEFHSDLPLCQQLNDDRFKDRVEEQDYKSIANETLQQFQRASLSSQAKQNKNQQSKLVKERNESSSAGKRHNQRNLKQILDDVQIPDEGNNSLRMVVQHRNQPRNSLASLDQQSASQSQDAFHKHSKFSRDKNSQSESVSADPYLSFNSQKDSKEDHQSFVDLQTHNFEKINNGGQNFLPFSSDLSAKNSKPNPTLILIQNSYSKASVEKPKQQELNPNVLFHMQKKNYNNPTESDITVANFQDSRMSSISNIRDSKKIFVDKNGTNEQTSAVNYPQAVKQQPKVGKQKPKASESTNQVRKHSDDMLISSHVIKLQMKPKMSQNFKSISLQNTPLRQTSLKNQAHIDQINNQDFNFNSPRRVKHEGSDLKSHSGSPNSKGPKYLNKERFSLNPQSFHPLLTTSQVKKTQQNKKSVVGSPQRIKKLNLPSRLRSTPFVNMELDQDQLDIDGYLKGRSWMKVPGLQKHQTHEDSDDFEGFMEEPDVADESVACGDSHRNEQKNVSQVNSSEHTPYNQSGFDSPDFRSKRFLSGNLSSFNLNSQNSSVKQNQILSNHQNFKVNFDKVQKKEDSEQKATVRKSLVKSHMSDRNVANLIPQIVLHRADQTGLSPIRYVSPKVFIHKNSIEDLKDLNNDKINTNKFQEEVARPQKVSPHKKHMLQKLGSYDFFQSNNFNAERMMSPQPKRLVQSKVNSPERQDKDFSTVKRIKESEKISQKVSEANQTQNQRKTSAPKKQSHIGSKNVTGVTQQKKVQNIRISLVSPTRPIQSTGPSSSVVQADPSQNGKVNVGKYISSLKMLSPQNKNEKISSTFFTSKKSNPIASSNHQILSPKAENRTKMFSPLPERQKGRAKGKSKDIHSTRKSNLMSPVAAATASFIHSAQTKLQQEQQKKFKHLQPEFSDFFKMKSPSVLSPTSAMTKPPTAKTSALKTQKSALIGSQQQKHPYMISHEKVQEKNQAGNKQLASSDNDSEAIPLSSINKLQISISQASVSIGTADHGNKSPTYSLRQIMHTISDASSSHQCASQGIDRKKINSRSLIGASQSARNSAAKLGIQSQTMQSDCSLINQKSRQQKI